jgi:hypothetical protein
MALLIIRYLSADYAGRRARMSADYADYLEKRTWLSADYADYADFKSKSVNECRLNE